MGCYDIPSNFQAYVKERLKDELPNVFNVWDTMDSFDGIFLEEASSEMDSDVTSSDFGTELDLSFDTASSASIRQILDESIRCQEELDRIFGPSIPYILKLEDIFLTKRMSSKNRASKKERKEKKKNWNKSGRRS